jgi:hypothetical protein
MSRHGVLSLLLLLLSPSISACIESDPDGVLPDANMPDTNAQPTKRGWLEVRMLVPAFESIDPETTIAGGFIAAPNGCEHTTLGACEVHRCPTNVTETLASPGKLHLFFPGAGEFGWDPGAFPIHFAADAIPWAAGEMIKLHADGKDVPPFTLAVPSPRTLDAGFEGPLLDQTLSRSSSLQFSWPSTPGTVVVTVEQNSRSDRPKTQITCKFSGPAGSAQIPTTALSQLAPTSSAYTDTEVRGWLAETQVVTAGDYLIELRALRNWSDQVKRYKVQ